MSSALAASLASGIGDHRRKVDHVLLINFDVVDAVADGRVNAVCENSRRIARHSAIHPVGELVETPVSHLRAYIRLTVPEEIPIRTVRPRRHWIERGKAVDLNDQSPRPQRALRLRPRLPPHKLRSDRGCRCFRRGRCRRSASVTYWFGKAAIVVSMICRPASTNLSVV